VAGYALRQTREQSTNRELMGNTGTALIVGGIAIVLPLIMTIASVSSLLAFQLFVKEYKLR